MSAGHHPAPPGDFNRAIDIALSTDFVGVEAYYGRKSDSFALIT